jgi:hypothetical protein
MMQNLRKYKMPIIIIIVLLVAFIIYSYIHGSQTNNSILTTTTTSSSTVVGQDFVNQLLTLKSIQLNDAIFSNPSFNTLTDFSQPVPTEPQGRPNPFAPIGVDSVNGPTVYATGSSTNFNNLNFTTSLATSSRAGSR